MKKEAIKSDSDTIIAEYLEKSLLYQNFASTMQNLMVNLLDNNGFKYQISMRLKSPDSIREKIARKHPVGKVYRRLNDLTDLVGVRIVFYLESDKQKFIELLFREFSPDKMQIEEHDKESGYRSTHIVLQFGRKRLSLNEYRKFAGLQCELQLTSALYHAWSEVEHGIFYKRDNRLIDVDEESMQALKAELETALNHHIHSASNIFESVADRIKQLCIKHQATDLQKND